MRYFEIPLLLLFMTVSVWSSAQSDANFSVDISTDSVLMGNYFTISFSLENAAADHFEAPDFSNFEIVSGPNYSTQMSIMNGAVSQSIAYTYQLRPIDLGDYYIDPATVFIGDEVLETAPLFIRSFPNPDGIIQNQPSRSRGFGDDFFGSDFWGDDRSFDFSFPQWMDEMPSQKDTVQQQPRKRKTTKI